MKCPNCNKTRFYEIEESWVQCLNCGWMVCRACGGTGAIDAPFSGSDPSCEACSGEGGFDPEYTITDDPLKIWSGKETG